ncbi:galactosylceramide sulfotransferase-like [Diadema antillarum]|uniref:galactosylceramide sulfotransferase-like n=1 Tax=Diadema antillarum TaxID=105358 RepID=UPI003A855FDB
MNHPFTKIRCTPSLVFQDLFTPRADSMASKAYLAYGVIIGLVVIILLGFVVDIRNDSENGILSPIIGGGSRLLTNGDSLKFVPPKATACKPQQNIVFIKTHKTASTTAASIFDNFAVRNNLSVAIPQDRQPYMHRTKLFHRDMMANAPQSVGDGEEGRVSVNIFSSHARYNRPEMDAVVPDAKYVTVLRDPASQFVSAFVFFHFDERLRRKFDRDGRRYKNVLEEFLDDPEKNFKLLKDHPLRHVIHNQQFFDLGLNTDFSDDSDAVDAAIARLDEEMDLVLITEHFDESLILMRKVLCWDTADIFYVRKMVHNTTQAFTATRAMRRKIRRWNAADVQLYDHFNRTLWRRITEYGPTFEDELSEFRKRLKGVTNEQVKSHRHVVLAMADKMNIPPKRK